LSRRVFLLSFAVSGRSGVEARRARLASTHVISARCKARRCQKRREMHIILDMQGRARRETARRRNSECKIDLSSRNSSRGNGSIGLQRSGDWLAARCSDQCAAPMANHRCAAGLLTVIAAIEFRLLKLILRRRVASCRALPCTSSFVRGPKFITSPAKVW